VNKGGSDEGAWLVMGLVTGVGLVMLANAGWVKLLTEVFDVIRHLSNGEGRLDPLVTGLILIKIDEAFSL
jgi:hypothetical protein